MDPVTGVHTQHVESYWEGKRKDEGVPYPSDSELYVSMNSRGRNGTGIHVRYTWPSTT